MSRWLHRSHLCEPVPWLRREGCMSQQAMQSAQFSLREEARISRAPAASRFAIARSLRLLELGHLRVHPRPRDCAPKRAVAQFARQYACSYSNMSFNFLVGRPIFVHRIRGLIGSETANNHCSVTKTWITLFPFYRKAWLRLLRESRRG